MTWLRWRLFVRLARKLGAELCHNVDDGETVVYTGRDEAGRWVV